MEDYLGGSRGFVYGLAILSLVLSSAWLAASAPHTISVFPLWAGRHSEYGVHCGLSLIGLRWLVSGMVSSRGLGVSISWDALKVAYPLIVPTGNCVKLMIRSIWPEFENLPNGLPASSNTNTRDFLSFFLFWLCSLPAIWFPVHKIRHLFTVKAFFVPIAGVAYLIWAIVKAHGIGPIVHQRGTKSGGALGWAVVSGIMSSIANFATLIVNDPDFSRFARKPRDAFWSQLITIPIGFAVTSFIGIIVSSSAAVIYDRTLWNPLDILSKFLDGAGGATRFGVLIIAFAFALAQLGTNIAANSVSAGTDLTALLPRFLDIRRGGYICAAVGLAMCPWWVILLISAPFFVSPLLTVTPC